MLAVLMVAGGVILLALAGYAAYLHYRLRLLKSQQASLQQNSPQRNGPRQDSQKPTTITEPQVPVPVPLSKPVSIEKSVYLIADGLLSEKMTLTEGSLRICALAGQLELSVKANANSSFRKRYEVLFNIAAAAAHFPILDDWQRLDKQQKMRVTKERLLLEAKYAEAALDAATRLKEEFK